MEQSHGRIEGSLSTEGGEQDQLSLDSLPLQCLDLPGDNFLKAFRRDRLYVSALSKFRVSHDRRRVRIDEHDTITLLFECFTSLGARIIELASLADNNRASANDQDR